MGKKFELGHLIFLARKLRDGFAHPLARWIGGGIAAGVVLGILLLVYWHAPASLDDEASHITFFQIGTGPSDGAYFTWGGRLAAVISRPPDTGACEPGGPCGVEGVLAVVKSSAGSVANVRAIATHHIQSALVQSIVLDQAIEASGVFRGEKPFKTLRAIANVQRETVYLVAGRASGIVSPADLKGKRLGFGVKGSGADDVTLALLQAYGIARKGVEATYAEPERLSEMLLRNQLDAFVYVANDPSSFIADLANRGTINLVPINDATAHKMLATHRDLTPVMITDGAYRFIPQIETLSANVVWVCDESEDPALVRSLTEALFYPGNRDLLPMPRDEATPVGKPSNTVEIEARQRLIDQAKSNLVIPLHPGADAFYQQEASRRIKAPN